MTFRFVSVNPAGQRPPRHRSGGGAPEAPGSAPTPSNPRTAFVAARGVQLPGLSMTHQGTRPTFALESSRSSVTARRACPLWVVLRAPRAHFLWRYRIATAVEIRHRNNPHHGAGCRAAPRPFLRPRRARTHDTLATRARHAGHTRPPRWPDAPTPLVRRARRGRPH